MIGMLSKRDFSRGLIAIFLGGLALRTFLLSWQPVSFDDFDVAISAINYLENGQLGPTMWNHPDLRSILVYWSLRLFGTGVLGLKGISLLFGALCVPLIGVVCRDLTGDNRIGLLAALLMAVDSLAIDFSRQAINDIYLAFFPMLGIYLYYRYRGGGRQLWLLASGAAFGLGLASKWSVAFPMAVTLAMALNAIRRETRGLISLRLARTAHALSALLILPLILYILTFIPWFAKGHSVGEWAALQRSMYIETSQHTGYRTDAMVDKDIRAYEWFIRPVTFRDLYFNIDTEDQLRLSTERNATIILAVTNPLVWLLVLPAMGYMTFRGWREGRDGLIFLSALFVSSYLPLAVVRRPIWLNTALSVLPYALMTVAFFLWSMAGKFRNPVRILTAYAGLILLVTPLFYVLAIGQGLKTPVVKEYLMKRYLSAGMDSGEVIPSADEISR